MLRHLLFWLLPPITLYFPTYTYFRQFWVKSQRSITLNNSKTRNGRVHICHSTRCWKSHLASDNYDSRGHFKSEIRPKNYYCDIYINAQLSYFKIPQVNMYMFNWKRARAQLKHAHAQLKAWMCTTSAEACVCCYVVVKRAYAQLVACTCSQLREQSWTQKNWFCNAGFFHLNIL